MEIAPTNKMVTTSKNKVVAPLLEKFTFPATLEYSALVVEAESHEAAESIYLKNRKPISGTSANDIPVS